MAGSYEQARRYSTRFHHPANPRIYYSAYSPKYLADAAKLLDASEPRDISTWCIFDNTTLGAATADALAVKSRLLNRQRVPT